MSNFKFNFSGEDNAVDQVTEDDDKSIKWLESEQVLPNKQIDNLDDKVTRARMFTCGDVYIGHVVVHEALASIEESGFKNAIDLAEKEHSDLVAGKYEGGLKIWECTYDLVEYFEDQPDTQFENKKVLDLGCGAGILGIYTFQKGASVTFQDYNKEVLDYVTIPNVLLNIEEENERETELKKCTFYSGDWQSFNKKLPADETYDVILTSETIYNDKNYNKLIELLVERLDKNGVAYVAAKTYYFGVGGGTRQFEQSIEKNGKLKSEIVWKSAGGIQREILKITHHNL